VNGTCASCHESAFMAAASPSHTAGGFPRTCEDCHTNRVVAAGEVRPLADALPPDRDAHRSAVRRVSRWRRYAGTATSATPAIRKTTRAPRTRTTRPAASPRAARTATTPGRGGPPTSTTTRRASRSPAPTRGRSANAATPAGATRDAVRLQLVPPARLRADDEPEPPGGRLPDDVPDLSRHERVAPRERRPQPDALPAHGRARAHRLRALSCGRPLHRHAVRLQLVPPARLRADDEPEPRGGWLLDRVPDLSRHERVAPREPGPQPHALPAHGRARTGRLRALPHRGPLHRHAVRLQLVPPARLRADDEPEPRGGRLPDHVPGLPHHERVAPGERRPQPHALPAHGSSHASHLRELPHGRALHRHPHGLQRLPPGRLPAHHQSEPPVRGLPEHVRHLPRHERLAASQLGPRRALLPDLLRQAPRKWSSCSDCHVTAGSFRVFECILCHEHSNRSEVDSKHRGVSGYAYQSAACYRCHPRGTK
jgi:hypothetical protein